MVRLADRISPPLVVASITTLALGLRCAIDRPVHRTTAAVEIHVKLRHAHAALALDANVQPLFSHAPADASDARTRWLRFDGDPSLVAELAANPEVETAFVAPETTLPHSPVRPADDSCPINTPSFESYQGYLGPAPHGIDAPAAWRRGVRGAGVWFADIEGAWNTKHEDLPGDRIRHVGGRPIRDRGWQMHGTAVLGEVVGRDNGKGVVGIAPDVERVVTSSIGGTSVADAIDAAQAALRAGDVLLIELQSGGPRGRWLPVEYWDDVYDAIKVATGRGVIVIEAAGNGGENLDDPTYDGKLDRARRDSGAIMVGAGGPPRDGYVDRARLDFSNYGGRVDVQGWGRMVATLDYGDLQACDDGADRHYTGRFSGTSSASPIVAGAAVLVQSTARTRGRTITPARMRALLASTGSPQVDGRGGAYFGEKPRENIGPRPDLRRALNALDDESRPLRITAECKAGDPLTCR
jgi:subtilisin family serine protease